MIDALTKNDVAYEAHIYSNAPHGLSTGDASVGVQDMCRRYPNWVSDSLTWLEDVVVVSSANPEAVREDWKRFGLIEDVDLLCTQEMGSKAYCIARLCEKGYGGENLLMCGDAPGDDQAAASNGVLYYPILVSHENESWQLFLDEALDRFVNGAYAGEYQEARRAAFDHNLGL